MATTGRVGRLVAAPLVLAALLLGGFPAPARAGIYVAAQCDPALGVLYQAAFRRSSDRYRGSASCRPGALGLTIQHQGGETTHGRFGAWTWIAPPGLALRGVALRASLRSGGGHVPQLTVGRDGGAADFLGWAEGRWRDEFWSGTSGRWFRARLRCYGGADRFCDASSDAHVWVRRLRFTLEDSRSPRISLGGGLLDSAPRSGSQALSVSVTDVGGGARRIEIAVNGKPLASHLLACAIAGGWALRLSPCPAAASRGFTLDTAEPPFRNGANQLEACVSDLAGSGSANRTCTIRSIEVDNSCPSSPLSSPLASSFRAGFAGGQADATVRFGQRARIAGELRAGAGIPGARVCVLERNGMPGAPWQALATLGTDREGRFTHAARVGPSRAIRLVYRRGAVQRERLLALRVRAVAKLRVEPAAVGANGRVRFSGVAPGPGNAARLVELQVKDGGRWRTFQSARTGLRGLFRAAYRFARTSGPITYMFRVRIRRQAGYPYLTGTSRARRVQVG